MKALFDTNILIDYLRGIPAAKRELERSPHRAISLITWMEVLAGARSDAEEEVIELFLNDFEVVPPNRRIAREAVALRRSHGIRLPDAIIWATARETSARLVTRNTKDFPATERDIYVPYSL